MTTALVTLAIGESYLERWRRMCERGWRAYAEMRPLSFEIQERKLEHFIDTRFNALVNMLILQEELQLDRPLTPEETTALLTREYHKNYFLHFAGRQKLMVGRTVPR